MKEIKILILIIVILAIIFGIKVLGVFENKEKMTLEQVKEIVSKSENVNNYMCKYKISEKEEVILKYRENKEKSSFNNTDIYTDYTTNEQIAIDEESKTAIVYGKDKIETTETFLKNRTMMFYDLLETVEEYNYIGEEIYNNYNCIVIEFKYKYESTTEKYDGQTVNIKMWINKENGVIMKRESKMLGTKEIEEIDYQFNCVKEEDVKIPDISKYKITEI